MPSNFYAFPLFLLYFQISTLLMLQGINSLHDPQVCPTRFSHSCAVSTTWRDFHFFDAATVRNHKNNTYFHCTFLPSTQNVYFEPRIAASRCSFWFHAVKRCSFVGCTAQDLPWHVWLVFTTLSLVVALWHWLLNCCNWAFTRRSPYLLWKSPNNKMQML